MVVDESNYAVGIITRRDLAHAAGSRLGRWASNGGGHLGATGFSIVNNHLEYRGYLHPTGSCDRCRPAHTSVRSCSPCRLCRVRSSWQPSAMELDGLLERHLSGV